MILLMYCFNGKFREELDLSWAKICRSLRSVYRSALRTVDFVFEGWDCQSSAVFYYVLTSRYIRACISVGNHMLFIQKCKLVYE